MQFLRLAFLLMCLIVCKALTVDAQNNFKIQGKWVVDFSSTLQHMGSVEKERYDQMPDRSKEHMERSFKNRTFEFGEDGVLTIQYSDTNGYKSFDAEWSYDADENNLIITIGSTRNEYKILLIDLNSIGLIYKNEQAQGLLKELYLNGIN
jgi:hypothetical protein